jgi:NAD(P)H dehydrogenase (quinone)
LGDKHAKIFAFLSKAKSHAMPYVLVLYYSRSGAVAHMAQLIARGIGSVDSMEAKLRTVPPLSTTTTETAAVPDQGAPYASLDDLKGCAGLALGSPTHFGNMAAPLKHFLDTTSGLWLSGDLVGKVGGVFCSTSSLHGGQESTLLSMMTPLFHHGMLLSGMPYAKEPTLFSTQSGGTPYGPTHVAGQNNDNPISADEKQICLSFGKYLAQLTLRLDGSV